MRKKYIFGKKLYISILTSIVVLMTTIATTFAWVGVFANSTFDNFNFKLKSSSLEEYGPEISLTGEEGTFTDSIDSIDIKKQILINWGYDPSELDNDDIIELHFSRLKMEQCTTLPVINGGKIQKFGKFVGMNGVESSEYFKFDIYVSATRYYDSGTPSPFTLDLFLEQGLITGTTKSRSLINPFKYPSSFVNPLSPSGTISPVSGGYVLSEAKTNSKYAARVGFEKYKVVDKNHPEQYLSSDEPISSVIYSGDDYDYPVYDTSTEVYDFGGILPDEINLATDYYNSIDYYYATNGIRSVSISNEMYEARGCESVTKDLILSSNTNQLIDSQNIDEQIGINQMMKVTVYFWIEGWDADCWPAINNSPLSLSIVMNIKNDELF